MNKLTADKCRSLIAELNVGRKDWAISIKEGMYLQALEIALPVLEQQESDGDIFIVMRNPGKVPDIKRPVGDVSDYLLQLYQHNPEAVCDVVTYRFAGGAGQWVQDGREMLSMLDVLLPPTDTYRQIENDGWIEWKGGEMPVSENSTVDVRLRNGEVRLSEPANSFIWSHGYYHYVPETAVDIIAYRQIENDGREG
jgi:hypothetical protein